MRRLCAISSILEGLDEILTVIRLGLPHELRRSLACTNIVENALGTVRQVTRYHVSTLYQVLIRVAER